MPETVPIPRALPWADQPGTCGAKKAGHRHETAKSTTGGILRE